MEVWKPSLELWKREPAKSLLKTRVFEVVERMSSSPQGKGTGNYYSLLSKNWVSIVAITTDQKLVLVEQYRHGIDDITLELPGGIVDETQGNPEENAFQSAKRELEEETAYTTRDEFWSQLGKVSGNPAILNNWVFSFYAKNVEPKGKIHFDHGEETVVHLIDLEKIPDLILQGIIHHPTQISALAQFFWKEYGTPKI